MDQWQAILALVGPLVLQWLKGQTWFKWLNVSSSSWVKVAWSAVVACLSVVGISVVCDFKTAHNCVINGLDPASLVAFGEHFVLQFLAQHVFHTGLKAYGKSN